MNEINRLKNEINNINAQIESHITSEEDALEISRIRDQIKENLATEGAIFIPGTEIENLVLKREQLQNQLEDAKALLEADAAEVNIQGTAAQMGEAQQVPARAGLFSRFGKWIKGIFARKKPDSSVMPKMSKKERTERINQTIKEELIFDKEKETRKKEAAELTDSLKKQHKSVANTKRHPGVYHNARYSQLSGAFDNANWGEPGVERFLDILTDFNDRTWDDMKKHDLVVFSDYKFSENQINMLLENRDHDTVARFLEPLFSFDLNAFLKKYPLLKSGKEESRYKYLKELDIENQRLMSMLSFSREFAMDILTQEEKDKVERAALFLPKINEAVQVLGSPYGDFSYKENLGKRVEGYKDFENCWENRASLKDIYHSVSERKKLSHKYDRQTLDNSIFSIENFSLITGDGRPRLLGFENCAQLLRYGREDLAYYADELDKALVAVELLNGSNPFAEANVSEGISEEKRGAILKKVEEIKQVYKTLEIRFKNPGTIAADAREVAIQNGEKSAVTDLYVRQNKDLDDFESGKWQERRSKETAGTRAKKDRALAALDNRISQLGKYTDNDKNKLLESYRTEAQNFKQIEGIVGKEIDYRDYQVNDADKALEYSKELLGLSLIDKYGRPRLLGNEEAVELLEHGKEDLSYYNKLRLMGSAITEWIQGNEKAANDIFGQETIYNIRDCFVKAGKSYDGLKLRLEKANEASFEQVSAKIAIKRTDTTWQYKLQRKQLEEFSGDIVESLSRNGEITVLPKSERELLIFEHQKELDIEKAELRRLNSNLENMGKIRSENKHFVSKSYSQALREFKNNGWVSKKTLSKAEDMSPEEAKVYIESQQTTDLQSFFGEFGNRGCFSPENINGDEFNFSDSEFKFEDIIDLLKHRNADSVEKLYAPVFDFDMEETLKRYPFDKLETREEIIELGKKAYKEFHYMIGIIQWAEMFGDMLLSSEQQKRVNKAVARFNLFSNMFTFADGFLINSFKTIYRENIGDEKMLRQYEEWIEHTDDMKSIRDASVLEYEANKEKKQTSQTIDLVRRVKSFSLVDGDRPRLLGLEDYQCYVKYGQKDLLYYMSLKDDADELMRILDANPDEVGLSDNEIMDLKDKAKKISRVNLALNNRLTDSGRSRTLIYGYLREGISDKLWYERMQNEELG